MTSAKTMRAAILDTHGAAFRIASVPRPHPQPEQVLVRIEASAVNPLDIKIRAGHVVSALGWGTHALAPLSFRAATYSGVFTLLPILTGEGRAHHGEIMREATRLIEAGKVAPRVDPRHFTLSTLGEAYRALESGDAAGKIVVDIQK
jgi:NADPH:quinone reductase-like Zn-dependent oxidoreductase